MDKGFQKFGEKYTLKQCLLHNQKILNTLEKFINLLNNIIKILTLEEMKNSVFEEGKFIYDVFTYIVRDWSIERKKEREDNYNIIINEVLKYFPSSDDNSMKYKIFIPGSGVNRLGHRLSKLAYDIEPNVFLFLNAFFSDYIFNKIRKMINIYIPILMALLIFGMKNQCSKNI